MGTYRICTRDGVEIATVEAKTMVEATMSPAGRAAPPYAEAIRNGGGPVFARKEIWMGAYPGWSLIAMAERG
jgi:hypothetical protein